MHLQNLAGEKLLELIGEALVSKPAFWVVLVSFLLGYVFMFTKVLDLIFEKRQMQKELKAIRSDLDAVLAKIDPRPQPAVPPSGQITCPHCNRQAPGPNYCEHCGGVLSAPRQQFATPTRPRSRARRGLDL